MWAEMQHVCTWVDAAVYIDGNDAVKHYARPLNMIEEYHDLQNKVAEKWSIKVDVWWDFEWESFDSIEISTLKLEDTLEEIKKEAFTILWYKFNINRTASRQRGIIWMTMEDARNYKGLGDNNLSISQSDYESLFEQIVTSYQEDIKYRKDDLNAMNVMITWVENGVLKCTVTDIGADIKDLVKRNKS